MNDHTTTAQRRVSFPDLVRIHFRWRKAVNENSDASDAEQEQLDEDYRVALARFEDEHGEMISVYWCAHVESAVALTAGKPTTGWLRRLLSVAPRFHRVSDWATKDDPDIARALHDCDELSIRIGEVLRGRNRRISTQLVMTSACHLLSVVDARSDEHRGPLHKEAVIAEQREIAALRAYYRDAANGDAQLVYFLGMTVGIALLALPYLAAHKLALIDVEQTIIGSIVAGALGATVSVIARINSGTFALDFDVARGYTLFLGGLRPFLGAVFGLLSYFMLTSGFVQAFELPASGTVERFYFLSVIAFAAGFSERWAQDTLTGGLTGKGDANDDGPPPRAAAAVKSDRRGASATDLEIPKR